MTVLKLVKKFPHSQGFCNYAFILILLNHRDTEYTEKIKTFKCSSVLSAPRGYPSVVKKEIFLLQVFYHRLSQIRIRNFGIFCHDYSTQLFYFFYFGSILLPDFGIFDIQNTLECGRLEAIKSFLGLSIEVESFPNFGKCF